MPSDSFPFKAILAVHETRQDILPPALYVVWFSKTLKNWKALVSTDQVSKTYWEVTHNGENGETYVDEYIKMRNTVIRSL